MKPSLAAVLIAGVLANAFVISCGSSGARNVGARGGDGGTDDSGGSAFGGSQSGGSFLDGSQSGGSALDGSQSGGTRVVLGPGVTSGDVARFGAASPTGCGAPRVDYPLEGAVMPRNVYPPNLMWTPQHSAQPTDLYRVRLERPSATLEGYFLNGAGFQNAWRPAVGDFSPVANADLGSSIRLTVSVLTTAGLCQDGVIQFRTVDAYIAGSVYYWSPPNAKIFRVDVDKGLLVDFMPHNPGCIACHGVTRDGRRMAGYASDGVQVYDLTQDLTADPPPPLYTAAVGLGERISAFNADGSRLLLSQEGGGPLDLYSGTTGAQITLDILGGNSGADPEWSPDDTAIAYTDSQNVTVVAAMAGDTFGSPATIHQGASSPGGNIDWHPTWSPDSQWLAYQHGTVSRFGSGRSEGPARLWLITRTGSGNVSLDQLNGTSDNWRPVFSPFDSGGYFWLLFTSDRSYGNQLAGVQGQKQIWIAAIHDKPGSFSDPSEVPYYMDGQESATNLSPYWAPAPCRPNATSCTTDDDCCTGHCAGDGTCGTAGCRTRGGTCGSSSDCCSGLQCQGGLCDYLAQ